MQLDEEPTVITPCQRTPERFYSEDLVEQKRAKEMCALCPFRAACLRKAFRIDARGGIWGGFDEVERSFYRKLFGNEIGGRVQPLPAGLVRRIERNRVMRTGPDVELVALDA